MVKTISLPGTVQAATHTRGALMVWLWIYKVILFFTSPEHALLISMRLLVLLKLPRIGLYCNITLNSLRQTEQTFTSLVN